MTYHELVVKRKEYTVTMPGLINQSSLGFDDGDFLDPWAKWQRSATPDILVIGQDWGNVKYYEENLGFDNDNNPTCKNLQELFAHIGIDIGTPTTQIKDSRIHFANVISFIRTGQMQGDLPLILSQEQINNFAEIFIKPLINILGPRIVIALGLASYKAIMSIYGKPVTKYQTLKSLIENGPITLESGLVLFPMYHCGASVINRNRNLASQKADWLKLKAHLDLI